MTEDDGPATEEQHAPRRDQATTPADASRPPKSRIPSELPVIPSGTNIVYPQQLMPVLASEERDTKAIDAAANASEKMLAIFSQQMPADGIAPADGESAGTFREIGTAATVVRMAKSPDGSVHAILQGGKRIRLIAIQDPGPPILARIEELEEFVDRNLELEAVMRDTTERFQRVVSLSDTLPNELGSAVADITDPSALADFVAANLPLKPEDRYEVLAQLNVNERLNLVRSLLRHEQEVLEVQSKIQSDVRGELDKRQREFILREQMKAIQKELGEETTPELAELREKLENAGLPEAIKKEADREIQRLAQIPTISPEYQVARTYLEWIADLPWSKGTEDNLDIKRAAEDPRRRPLRPREGEAPHPRLPGRAQAEGRRDQGPHPLLRRAARHRQDLARPVDCPRARAQVHPRLARRRARRGGDPRPPPHLRRRDARAHHPGDPPRRLQQPADDARRDRQAGQDFRGDPSSALLEVLDPAQNSTFTDHYLDIPFDLSKTFFIATANMTDTIPGPLLDRMEVIELPGYTEHEKLEIAKRYLLPRQIEANGVPPETVKVTDTAIREIIRSYTREAGVRNLERELGSVCRRIARRIAEGDTDPITVTEETVHDFLGPPRFRFELANLQDEVGVATGLAATMAGGDVLFIEATATPGKGRLVLTGKLGDVMQESAQAALTYARSRAESLGVSPAFFDMNDVHIHVPAGAVPKDGPSAGVTLATALVSIMTRRPVRKEVAMTGEITLRGKVLPVGAVRDKVLAAHRAGVKTVIIPKDNENDLADIPEDVRHDLELKLVEHVDEVLNTALHPAPVADEPDLAPVPAAG